MPEKDRNKAGGAVYQKLVKLNSDETHAELNKQVFALLVLAHLCRLIRLQMAGAPII
jgi:hypothetical protein